MGVWSAEAADEVRLLRRAGDEPGAAADAWPEPSAMLWELFCGEGGFSHEAARRWGHRRMLPGIDKDTGPLRWDIFADSVFEVVVSTLRQCLVAWPSASAEPQRPPAGAL